MTIWRAFYVNHILCILKDNKYYKFIPYFISTPFICCKSLSPGVVEKVSSHSALYCQNTPLMVQLRSDCSKAQLLNSKDTAEYAESEKTPALMMAVRRTHLTFISVNRRIFFPNSAKHWTEANEHKLQEELFQIKTPSVRGFQPTNHIIAVY